MRAPRMAPRVIQMNPVSTICGPKPSRRAKYEKNLSPRSIVKAHVRP